MVLQPPLSRLEKSPLHWVLAGGVILLAGWAAYSNSFRGPFIVDDPGSISKNPTIVHLGQLRTVLSPPSHGEPVSGRPILNLSFALNYAWGGVDVWGYHVTNLAIHLFNGLLLLEILRRTFLLPALQPRFGSAALPLAAVIALLWVVHPLQTEAVTYLSQRAESLASLFYLLTLYAVIRSAQSNRPLLWDITAVAACWLGIATKEIVVTAPVMVLLYDRTLLAGTFRQAWQRRWGLYLGLAASWALMIGLIAHRGFVTTAGGPDTPSIGEYARSQPGAILYYLRQVVWPHPLCLDWGCRPFKTWGETCLPTLGVGLLGAATLWVLLRGNAWGLLGAWFFLILMPSSSIVPLMQTACEHRMYLPLAAVITWLVISVYLGGKAASPKWAASGRLAIGLCLAILIAGVFGVLTFLRNQDYQSELAIWKDIATKASNNAAAITNYGTLLIAAGQLPEAAQQFRNALHVQPDLLLAYNNLGNTLLYMKQPLEAHEILKYAVSRWPDDANLRYNWGAVLSALGRFVEAGQQYKEAIRLSPDRALAYNNLGSVYMSQGRPADAIPYFEQAVRLTPDDLNLRNSLGMALAKAGRYPEAIAQFQRLLQLSSQNVPMLRFNLALVFTLAGRFNEAIECGRKAVSQMPADPQMNRSLAWLLATYDTATKAHGAEAVKLAQHACDLTHRQDAVCLDTLAAAYAAAGRFDEAVATAKEAWQLAQTQGKNDLAQEIQLRLQLYRDQKPYRENWRQSR